MALNNSRFLHFLNAIYTLGHAELSTSEMKYSLQVFMAGSVQTVVFWVVAVCNIVHGYRFGETCCLHLQGRLESENGRSMFLQNFLFTNKCDPEDRGSMLLEHIGIHLQDYPVPQPRMP
jgi:hypothetical protein